MITSKFLVSITSRIVERSLSFSLVTKSCNALYEKIAGSYAAHVTRQWSADEEVPVLRRSHSRRSDQMPPLRIDAQRRAAAIRAEGAQHRRLRDPRPTCREEQDRRDQTG